MAERATLNRADPSAEWQDQVKALLDTYLCEFGIHSERTRARWTNRVIEDLRVRAELVATEDILEDAVEHMRDLIEARIAVICNHDPAREHKQIAQILVVLLNEKYTDSLNMLFEHMEPAGDLETLEGLRHALAACAPVPVPEEAPLAMPVQTIELRSINPLRWLFGRSA